MRNLLFTALITVLSGALIGVPAGRAARAGGIPVIDVANLTQAITQVTNDATKIANQAAQISNQVNQINHQVQMLQNIGPSQFSGLTSALSAQSTELDAILASASQLQYSLASLQAQIDAAFPQGKDWSTFDMNSINARFQQWDSVITEANSIAMRAQTSLNRVTTRNGQIQALMAQAQGADGQVRQLQINAQLNGQIAQALNDNAAVAATAARAQMLALQRQVAARELGREQHRRAMANFADRGAAVKVLAALPAIAPHR